MNDVPCDGAIPTTERADEDGAVDRGAAARAPGESARTFLRRRSARETASAVMSHHHSHVTAEALRRRVVQVVRDVGDRESRVLEQARRANQAGHGEILLGRRQLCAKESTHQRARQHVEPACQRCGPSRRAAATRKSASKNRQQSCGTPARSMASWPSASRWMSSPRADSR